MTERGRISRVAATRIAIRAQLLEAERPRDLAVENELESLAQWLGLDRVAYP